MLLVAAGDRDGEGIAGLDGCGVVVKRRAGQHAFSLVADVEEDLVGGERDNSALQLRRAGLGLVRVGLLEGCEQIGEGCFWRVVDRLFARGGVEAVIGFWNVIVRHFLTCSIVT